jgi:ketosteroid isomerase-like protein
MTEPVSRAVVEDFYQAFGAGDLKRTEGFLADDVEWTVNGPVDVLLFCGAHRGKAAVLDMLGRLVPRVFGVTKLEPSTMLIDGDRVATLNRLWARHQSDGRMISYRLAHFMRFRGGKVVENLSLLDSFDAVEQVLGHPLTAPEQEPTMGDMIAI